MARLAFDRRTGLVYEGTEDPVHPVWPTPILTQATIIENISSLKKLPSSFNSSPFGMIFVDHSFDPSSRIRRGRLFQKFGNAGWEIVRVEPHPALSSDLRNIHHDLGRIEKELSIFIEGTNLLQLPHCGEGLQLALGQQDSFSLWRILQTERIATNDVLITLRAQSTFGILPQIDKSKICPEYLPGIESAIDRVLHSAYRELPQSVVDQCRNAAVMIISRWMQMESKAAEPTEQDLGHWIRALQKHFGEHEMVALRAALELINRLHPRGKDNEANKYKLRHVEESDAEYAVNALGFILREINWAL